MLKIRILWHKVKIKIVSKIVNLFASQTNYDIENTVLVLGSTRSGTTFLMESLNSKNEYRIIFEPFNQTYTKEWKAFGARHYIDPDNATEKETDAVEIILSGRIHNEWIDQYNKKVISNKRLIKSVRANLMVDYLVQKYPEMEILYIFRDPYKVVASRINLNFNPKDVYSILEHELFLKKYYSDIDISVLKTLLKSPESCHVALWCLENRYLLRSQKQRKIHILQYEDIIGKTLLLEDKIIVKSHIVRKPSVTSSIQNSHQLNTSENKNINEILRLFGMEKFVVNYTV